MKILYFAWMKQKIGTGLEEVDPPAEISTAGQLVDWLKDRGPGYEAAFKDAKAIKVAVNQDFATLDSAVGAGDEVAFFPPVTGG